MTTENTEATSYETFDLTERILNILTADMLNITPYFPSEDIIQAIDLHGERVKAGLAGVTVALLEVAKAIKAGGDELE